MWRSSPSGSCCTRLGDSVLAVLSAFCELCHISVNHVMYLCLFFRVETNQREGIVLCVLIIASVYHAVLAVCLPRGAVPWLPPAGRTPGCQPSRPPGEPPCASPP